MSFFVGAAAVAAFVAIIVWLKEQHTDHALQAEYVEMLQRAKLCLTPEDQLRLQAQLLELAAAGREAHRTGVSARQATRMGKRAAIQSIAAFIELESMLPTKGNQAA
jgi:hypothetical protein